MQIVRRDRFKVQPLAQPEQVVTDPLLDFQPMIHQLEIEVVRPENVAELGRRFACLLEVADLDPRLHLAGRATGHTDHALGIARQQLAVHPRLVEETLETRQRAEPEQVTQAVGVRRQQGHVRVRPAAGDVILAALGPPDPGLVAPVGPRGEIGLDPDHGLDAGAGRPLVEVVRPVERAVVGHRQGRHVQARRLGEQVLEPRGAVEHRVLRVHV
jgi:hypothetical protein